MIPSTFTDPWGTWPDGGRMSYASAVGAVLDFWFIAWWGWTDHDLNNKAVWL